MRRLILLLLFGVTLLTLVVYSQFQPQKNFVSGIIEAEEIRLGSRVGGRVKSVFVAEGDPIKTSDPLVEFEPYDLLEREQQAISELAAREAALQKLVTGLRAEEIAQAQARYEQAVAQLSLTEEGPRAEEIAAAENRLTAANADLQLATREYERQYELSLRAANSKSELDQAEERLTVAQSTVAVRKNELAILNAGARQQEIQIARAKVEDLKLAWELAKQGYRTEDVEQARAARDAAAAALEAIGKQKDELTIRAPSDGTVDSLDLQPGDLVAPNAPVLTTLSRNDLWVRAYVPQRFLQLRVGQELRVTVDSFPGQDFQGVVTFISRQAEFTPSNVQTPADRAKQVYRIRVTLSDQTAALRPGMTANVWLESTEPEHE